MLLDNQRNQAVISAYNKTASISRRLNFIEHPTGALSHLEELVKS